MKESSKQAVYFETGLPPLNLAVPALSLLQLEIQRLLSLLWSRESQHRSKVGRSSELEFAVCIGVGVRVQLQHSAAVSGVGATSANTAHRKAEAK